MKHATSLIAILSTVATLGSAPLDQLPLAPHFPLAHVSHLTSQVSGLAASRQAAGTNGLHVFAAPIDALSVTLREKDQTAQVRAFDGTAWSAWEELRVEDEQDPTLMESNLVVFQVPVGTVEFRSSAQFTVNPIRVSGAPASYRVAATQDVGTPRILSRRDWGADESLRLRNGHAPSRSDDDITSEVSGNGALTARQRECLDAIEGYPQDFKRAKKRVDELNGKPLLWPQEYSPSIGLLVVHHTAVRSDGDTRPGAERMRALYQYHAVNRGWGDIGYHYVIDDDGRIYQGRAGGDRVVGGHAYCNNVGTLGIALMGNFEVEEPTQKQVKSLQWLLQHLAEQEEIDLQTDVTYHGKSLPRIVGHRQLLTTDCPGYYLYEAMDQLRSNVAAGRIDKALVFPEGAQRMSQKQDKPRATIAIGQKGTFFFQDADYVGRPGGDVLFPVRFLASQALSQRSVIGKLTRSDERLAVYLVGEQEAVRLRDNVLLPQFLRKGDTTTLYIRVVLPPDPGTYQLTIDSLRYTLKAEGRRVRTATAVGQRRLSRQAGQTLGSQPNGGSASPAAPAPTAPDNGPLVRILLSYESNDPDHPDRAFLDAPQGARLDGKPVSGTVVFEKKGDTCEASNELGFLAGGTPRLHPHGKILTVESWNSAFNQFRGTIECRIVDGRLALINELPMEDYLRGLAEEPDSEPYEKQRAFAIAARTYAQWYLSPQNRKFPGKPYDGSDSPAVFQKYSGYAYELKHPSWLKALESTRHQVLLKDGQLIKPPYFSQSNGRTLSPAEAGWKTFPFAEVFASKPDPWCQGMEQRGHGVGMSGCGAEAQAEEGKTAEEILQYYYTGITIGRVR